MPRFRSELTNVLSHAIAELREPRLLNPAWLPHVDGSALAPAELREAERDLVRRALVAPVVAALGVSPDGDREELRIALDAEGAVLLTRRGDAPHEWMDAPHGIVPDLVRALLPPRASPRRTRTIAPTTRCSGTRT